VKSDFPLVVATAEQPISSTTNPHRPTVALCHHRLAAGMQQP